MNIKTIISSTLAIMLGIFLGKFMLNQYDSEFKLQSVFNQNNNDYYFLKQGEYDSVESMQENMMSFDYYIYEELEGKFITYLAITKDYDNFIKIQGLFNNAGITTYKVETNLNNEAFSMIIDQYDKVLKETEDTQTIKGICAQVLAKYEELVTNDSTN